MENRMIGIIKLISWLMIFISASFVTTAQSDINIIPLKINPTSSYNNFTKRKLYSTRKYYVSKSIFAHNNYQPKAEVFGGIEDRKPWYGINSSICFDSRQPQINKTFGPSSMSKFINNPEILIGVMIPYVFNYPPSTPVCSLESLKFIPSKMEYNKQQNRITSTYDIEEQVLKEKFDKTSNLHFTFITTNARDLGFNYGIINSSSGIKMKALNNISKNVVPFVNYFHTGSSCGIYGGCNNVSPRTTAMEFGFTTLPARVDFILWKNYPYKDPKVGDFYYTIIFQKKPQI